jgi:hypothetical protein
MVDPKHEVGANFCIPYRRVNEVVVSACTFVL